MHKGRINKIIKRRKDGKLNSLKLQSFEQWEKEQKKRKINRKKEKTE